MKVNQPFLVVVLAAASLMMPGCSVLEPKANLTEFYVLRAKSAVAKSAPTNLGRSEIRVGPGQIAAYLQDGQIAVQAGSNRIVYLEDDRWAEPLAKGVSRVLAENLAGSLDTATFAVYPDPPLTESGYEVRYTVESFEGSLTGPVVLIVTWQVVDWPSLKVIAARRSVYSVPAHNNLDTVANYVERLSTALGQWSDDMAVAISSH